MNKAVTCNITTDDIKEAIHKFDLLQHPYVLFVHPDRVEEFKKVVAEISDEYVIQPYAYCDIDKVYLMKREDLERWSCLNNSFLGEVEQ